MSPLRFVMLLGMHRSGTSCLAGCLERSGVFLGEVGRSDRNNAWGNLELDDARLLDERLLERGGGSWADPPEAIVVEPSDQEQMRAIVGAIRRREPCGFKDPRALLVVDAWLEAIGDAALIGTWRHPAAVVRSLERRNRMPAAQAYALWRRYNAELVRLHRSRPFPLIAFDLGKPARYCSNVIHVARELGLEPDVRRVVDFVGADLDHHTAHCTEVPESCRELYDYLRDQSVALAEDLTLVGEPATSKPSGPPHLTVVAGVPASGKSTWIRRLARNGDEVLMPDKGAARSLRPGGRFLLHYDILRPYRKMKALRNTTLGGRLRRLGRRVRGRVGNPYSIDHRLCEVLDSNAEVDVHVLVVPSVASRTRPDDRQKPDTEPADDPVTSGARAYADFLTFVRKAGLRPTLLKSEAGNFVPCSDAERLAIERGDTSEG